MDFQIKTEKKEEGIYIISIGGSLDSVTCEEANKQVSAVVGPAVRGIIFDMAGLHYISSMGFSVIFKTDAALKKNGGKVAVANLQPDVKRVFDTMRILPKALFDSVDAAYQYIVNKPAA